MNGKETTKRFAVVRAVLPLDVVMKMKEYCSRNFLSTSDGVLQMIERFFEAERFLASIDAEENKK